MIYLSIIKLIVDSYFQLLINLFNTHEEFILVIHINNAKIAAKLQHIITMSPGSIAFECDKNRMQIHCLDFALIGTQEFIRRYCTHHKLEAGSVEVYKI